LELGASNGDHYVNSTAIKNFKQTIYNQKIDLAPLLLSTFASILSPLAQIEFFTEDTAGPLDTKPNLGTRITAYSLSTRK
jgi:hypothetical protein